MRTMQDNETVHALIQEHPFVIITYSRATCAPCMAIHHRLEAFEKDHDICIFDVPLEIFPAIGAQRNIFGAPTIEGYVEGKMYIKESGYFSLDAFLERYEELMDFERKDSA